MLATAIASLIGQQQRQLGQTTRAGGRSAPSTPSSTNYQYLSAVVAVAVDFAAVVEVRTHRNSSVRKCLVSSHLNAVAVVDGSTSTWKEISVSSAGFGNSTD